MAALLAASGMAVPTARAADLGGNCCADLEERVAELEATAARKGNRKVSLTISGQVSTSVMAWDAGGRLNPKAATTEPVAAAVAGGKARDVYIVDNVMSGGSFFALTGDAKINPNLTAGFNMTVAFDTGGRSHQASQADDDGQPTTPTAAAHAVGGFDTFIVVTLANWYLDHKQLGRVTVGRINTSTAGISTIDLGGAGVIANASIGYTQRGFSAVDGAGGQVATWANLLGGNTVNGASLSRAQAIQYTTPNVGGFTASASFGENDVWDAALRYAGEFSGFRVAAGIGFISNSSGLGDVTEDSSTATVPVTACAASAVNGCQPTQLKGSASIMHVATGLYLSGSYIKQDNDVAGRDDTTLWYLNGGISKNWTGLGNTVLYGEFARVDHGLQNFGSTSTLDSEATMWGLGIVQNVDAAAMELFLAYKNFSADISTGNVEDFQTVIGGARIRF